VTLALAGPVAAAERMADGRPGAPRLRELGRHLLAERRGTLEEIRLPPPDGAPADAQGPDLAAFLGAALDLLDRLAVLPPTGAEARAALEAYAAAWPDSPLLGPLHALVSR
jgi:hypothetical protein